MTAGRVGPILQAGAAADAVVSAIRELNQGVEVDSRGAYLRVSAPDKLRVTRAAIERHLGAPFLLRGDLERLMPSFAGALTLGEDEAVWERRPAAKEAVR